MYEVLPQQHRPGRCVDIALEGLGLAARDVHEERLPCRPHAVRGRWQGDETRALRLLDAVDLEGRPALRLPGGTDREHRDRLPGGRSGLRPRLGGAERRLCGEGRVAGQRRRDVGDLVAHDADDDCAVLGSRKAAEALTEDHRTSGAAGEHGILVKLERRGAVGAELEQLRVGIQEGARDGNCIAAGDAGGQVVAVLDERGGRAEAVPAHLGAQRVGAGPLGLRRGDRALAGVMVGPVAAGGCRDARKRERCDGGEGDEQSLHEFLREDVAAHHTPTGGVMLVRKHLETSAAMTDKSVKAECEPISGEGRITLSCPQPTLNRAEYDGRRAGRTTTS